MLNVYLVYKLGNWSINWTKKLLWKYCLLGAAELTRNTIRGNIFVWNCCETVFNGTGSLNFGKKFAWNFVIFGVGNSLLKIF